MLRLLPSVSSWYFLLQVATAQSSNIESITTSLIFGPWDVNLSVVAVDSTATTYVENNSDPSRTCNAEAYDRVTIINGPSTAGVTYIFTSCDTLPAYQYQVDCPLTEANTATCNIVYTDENSTSTTIVTENSSELSPQPVTITAGLEKLVPLSVPARTTSSLSPSSSTESSGSRTSSPTASDSRTSSVVGMASPLLQAIIKLIPSRNES